jgi:hypothetical protein
MKSLLRSIFGVAYNCTTWEKADVIQWHSREEANAKWRLIMAKYRSPMSEAVTMQRREETVAVGDVLQLSCDREDPLTEMVVTKIVDLAKAGERDPEIHCIDVLAELGTPAPGGLTPAIVSTAAEPGSRTNGGDPMA